MSSSFAATMLEIYMKTYTTKHPFTEEKPEETVFVVLDEKETKWVKEKENVCHDLMKQSVKENAEKLQQRYKKTVVVYDSEGRFRHKNEIQPEDSGDS